MKETANKASNIHLSHFIMKPIHTHIRTLLALIVLSLASIHFATAQIQRNFFCGTLGVSTKAQIIAKLKAKNIPFKVVRGDIQIDNVDFAGDNWSCDILFYKKHFLGIGFTRTNEDDIYTDWDYEFTNLTERLNNKYSMYKDKEQSDEDSSIFYDGATSVKVYRKKGNDTTLFMNITYYDRKLANDWNEANDSEL